MMGLGPAAMGYAAPPPPPPPSIPGAPRQFNVTLDWNKLAITELIGQGMFGYVHRAKYDRTPVAIKRLACQLNDTELIALFNRELSVVKYAVFSSFCSLSALFSLHTKLTRFLFARGREIRHPNILQFLYYHDQPPNMLIMTELMPGSLLNFIGNSQFPFELPHVVKVSLGIARALSFLHSLTPPVLHRDLRSQHIMVRVSAFLSSVCCCRLRVFLRLLGATGS